MSKLQAALACLLLAGCIQAEDHYKPPADMAECIYRFVVKAQTDRGAEIVRAYCAYQFNQ